MRGEGDVGGGAFLFVGVLAISVVLQICYRGGGLASVGLNFSECAWPGGG